MYANKVTSAGRMRASAGTAVAGGLFVGAALLMSASTSSASMVGPEGGAELPDEIVLEAVIRDFRAKQQEGGHPDFQAYAGTTTVGLASLELDEDGLPSAASLRGQKISSEFRDSQYRNMNPSMYDPSQGDHMGALQTGGTGNGLHSVESFSQWYRDTPGVNVSTSVPIVLKRQGDSNRYVFDSGSDAPYSDIGGFFPIDGELYGNYAYGHNFHFTTMIETEFMYDADIEQVFKFTGDDDVWVYIGGQLVIDLGGLHPKRNQFLDLSRLDWLEDGETYSLKVFHAERRTTASNFRIETTLNLRRIELPLTSALYD